MASGMGWGLLLQPLEVPVEGWGLENTPAQTPTFWSAGESCEAQDTVPTPDCANQCPRSCVDLWDRVECLQGPCRPGGQAMPTAWPRDSGEAHCLLLPKSL